MITRKHLHIFKTVALAKSMSKAAKILYISQPTISQKIQEIESFYHVKLFERFSKTLMITEEGQLLLEKGNLILSSFEEIDAIFNDDRHFPLKIGATLTIGSTIIAPLLKNLKDKYQQIQLQVYIDNSQSIEDKILTNQLDIALIEGNIDHPDIITTPVIHDNLIFVCSKKYQMAFDENISLESLCQYDFIDREEGSGSREQLMNHLKSKHLSIHPTWQCHSWESVKQALLYDHGFSIIPVKLVENEIKNGDLILINVEDIVLERNFCICHHRNKTINKKMQAFIDTCKAYY